jgi:AraC-like DNA-binding protein
MAIKGPEISQENASSPRLSAASLPHRLQIFTHGAPERDRFEVYREMFRQYVYQAQIENRSEGVFEGSIELLQAGSVGVSKVIAPQSTYARTRRHISDSDDSVTLFIGRTQGLVIDQAGEQHEFRPGNGFLYYGAIPGLAASSAPISMWGIKVAADRLMTASARRAQPMSISAERPAMKLITQYLHSFSTVAESSDADVRDAFGMHLSDLLMLIVGTDRDTLELIKGRGLKAARTDVVLRLIAREYASPNLSAERIGLTLGITARQVHRLLEETTKTFYEHLLERRLLEARRLLTDPSCGVLPVAEIAQRTGFVDRTHFNHTFRTRFGETPTDAREAAVRENARRFLGTSIR